MPPISGTASVSDEPTRISPKTPHLHHLGRSVAQEPHEDKPRHHQTSHPPTCANDPEATIIASPKKLPRGLQTEVEE